MGHNEGCVTLLKSPRYRLRAFVSTILKRLNKPPFLPQFCSTRANLYVIHTMAPRPTVIGTQGYRRGLASLSVVKERVLPSPSECPGQLFSAALSNLTASRSRQINWLGTCLVGLIRSRCAISPSSSVSPACAGILLRALVALRLASEIPCGTSSRSPLATNHCRKIKNPASSAGYSHPHLGGSTRCSTSF